MRIGRKEDTASKEGTSGNRILGKEISRRFLNIYVKAIDKFNCNNYNYNYKLKQNRLQLKDNGFLGRKRNRKGKNYYEQRILYCGSRPGIFKIKKQCLSSEALAENICTNPARVRKVMAKLKKAGLVSTKEGSEGGYSLAKNAQQITLKQISAALQIEFVSSHWRSGSQNLDCMVASGMADVMDRLYSDLDALCQKRLEGITIADVAAALIQRSQGKKFGCPEVLRKSN